MDFLMNSICGSLYIKLPAGWGIKTLNTPAQILLIILVVLICLTFLVVIIGLILSFERKLLNRAEIKALQSRKNLTPTQKFILAASSPTHSNQQKCVIDIWDTHKSAEEVEKVIALFEWGWGEFTNENARNMAYDCLERGYNTKYKEYCSMDASSPELVSKYSSFQRVLFEKMKQQYPKQGMLAWDLVRALSVVGGAYMGGAMAYEEAVGIAFEACKRLQENFSSWDDMVNNYTLGYQFWRNKKKKDRLRYYKQLKKTWIYDISWDTVLREDEL